MANSACLRVVSFLIFFLLSLRVSNISWAEQQVGGHADRHKTWQQMSWWERRNSEVDDIAQGYANELIATDDTIATNPKSFSEPCAV